MLILISVMYKTVVEGETRLYVPVEGSFGVRSSGKEKKSPVFYNHHMELNRTLCVLFVKAVGSELVFADVLAGSGAKGIRVALEAGNEVYLNDANVSAYDLMRKNVELNNLDVMVSNEDANTFMAGNRGCFDFIDIDPFGSPVPFINGAFLSSKKAGYIGVTATDTATLCGVYPETCARRYMSVPLRGMICHEVGLRILLGYAARTAGTYDKGIRPLLSHSTRHYFRSYLKVENGVKLAKKALNELGYLYFCGRCNDFAIEKGVLTVDRRCSCGGRLSVSGPLWLGRLHDRAVLESMLACTSAGKTHKLLKTLVEEEEVPFYFDVHALSKNTGKSPSDLQSIIDRLKQQGYKASKTHFSPVSIKTDAPISVVKENLS